MYSVFENGHFYKSFKTFKAADDHLQSLYSEYYGDDAEVPSSALPFRFTIKLASSCDSCNVYFATNSVSFMKWSANFCDSCFNAVRKNMKTVFKVSEERRKSNRLGS